MRPVCVECECLGVWTHECVLYVLVVLPRVDFDIARWSMKCICGRSLGALLTWSCQQMGVILRTKLAVGSLPGLHHISRGYMLPRWRACKRRDGRTRFQLTPTETATQGEYDLPHSPRVNTSGPRSESQVSSYCWSSDAN